MKRKTWFLLLVLTSVTLLLAADANARSIPARVVTAVRNDVRVQPDHRLPIFSADRAASRAAGWSDPAIIWPETWYDPQWFNLSDDGTRVVALLPDVGANEQSRPIAVSHFEGGAWQSAEILAENGYYTPPGGGFQPLPQETHPLISGDGDTITYVGYTGTTAGIYLSYYEGSSWTPPTLLNTGLSSHHYWLGLSADGRTLAFADYSFSGTQQLYVATRDESGWSSPLLIGSGGYPSLSAGGTALTYISNARVTYCEWNGSGWTAPVQLTTNDWWEYSAEYPQLSADGLALFYWLVTLEPNPEGSGYVRIAQDLYLMRREGTGWGAPQKVNAAPVLPAFSTEGPAAADAGATRLIYTRPVTETDTFGKVSVYASHLDLAEWDGAGWQESRLVEVDGYGNFNQWPRLTPDGLTLVFDTWIRRDGVQEIYDALWQMETTAAPPPPPLPTTTESIISELGGILQSLVDATKYQIPPGTFTDTVRLTHTYQPTPPAPPPSGRRGIGRGFSATAIYSATGQPAPPKKPFTITIGYTDVVRGPVIPGTLRLWRWEGGTWVLLPGVDDVDRRELMTPVDHLSDFAVFGETYQVFLPLVQREE